MVLMLMIVNVSSSLSTPSRVAPAWGKGGEWYCKLEVSNNFFVLVVSFLFQIIPHA